MTLNLRFNKSLTKKLIKSIPCEENKKNKKSLDWALENTNKLYGSFCSSMFGISLFIIQKKSEDMYRIIASNNKGLYGFYIIDDINEYLDFIGVEELFFDNQELISAIIEETLEYPNTGIINIDDGRIFVYEHED